MNKNLLKRIIDAAGLVLAFIMVLITKVSITTSLGEETSNPLYKGYFEFISDAGKAEMYGFSRVMMIIGFILITVVMVYYLGVLVLSLLKQDKILNKLSLVSKIMNVVSIASIVLIVIAGIPNHEYSEDLVGHISLFSFTWVLALVFSAVPFASKYFIK